MSRVTGPLTEHEIREWRAYFAEPVRRRSWTDDRRAMAAENAEVIADAYAVHLRPEGSPEWIEAAERHRVIRLRCMRMVQAVRDGVITDDFRERFGCCPFYAREQCARIGIVLPMLGPTSRLGASLWSNPVPAGNRMGIMRRGAR